MNRILLIADHASNAIPPAYQPWGVSNTDMARHIAWDIGTADLARGLAAKLHCRAVIAPWSRLLIDLNRDPDHAGLIPAESDGTLIPHNLNISAAEHAHRLQAYFHPYHAFIAEEIAAHKPALIVALHSFTPVMNDFARPWHVGLLYNQDDRAARLAIDHLRQDAKCGVGDNEPYSGRELNYTMNRHAESQGIAYLSLEIRQDLLATADDVAGWVDLLQPMLTQIALSI